MRTNFLLRTAIVYIKMKLIVDGKTSMLSDKKCILHYYPLKELILTFMPMTGPPRRTILLQGPDRSPALAVSDGDF